MKFLPPLTGLLIGLSALQSVRSQAAGAEDLMAGKTAIKTDAKPAKKEPEKKKGPYDDEKPFADIVKDMQVVKGLFTFYRSKEENKVYLEIATNQLEKPFLYSATIDQATGEREMYSSQMGSSFAFRFRFSGKNVQWLIENPYFTATNGTPSARALARSVPNGMISSAKILSQPHPERKSLLINLGDLFLNDIENVGGALRDAYRPSDYHMDRGNSAITEVRAFPENVVFDVLQYYTSDSPKTSSQTLPDARSIPVVMKYDLSTLRETGYKPRRADDRVGHFLNVQADFTTDQDPSLYRRFIHRWKLEKANPVAALSEPKQPIVFWLENTIPLEYRGPMREGVLLWNKAFERIGFTNAVVVKQMPDGADWDPADSRYNTIRWFVGVDAAFAIGPSRANPYTGEIYDADIGFSEGIVRSIRRSGWEFVGAILPKAEASQRQGGKSGFCNYAAGLAEQGMFAGGLLEARGVLDSTTEQRLIHEFLVEVTAHEVGHTLGLRHNFHASTLLAPGDLNDPAKTGVTGQAGSVMDYNPIVLAPKGTKQGHFVPTTLGPYDYWAIEYAYKVIEGSEETELARIASRSAEPQLVYATDEDALGTTSPYSADPLVNQFDQSSDPLGFFSQRMELVEELWANMEARLLRPGEGYQVLRRVMGRTIGESRRALLIGSKFVGGVYLSRHHFGDPAGQPPYTPVPAAKQREALAFLDKHAFSTTAFQLPPGLQNKFASEQLPTLSGLDDLNNTGRLDYGWHDTVLGLQASALDRLLHPAVLARLLDNELRYQPGEEVFRIADLFTSLDRMLWSELDANADAISSIRRNLQRAYTRQLIRMTLRTYSLPPEDATSLARESLNKLRAKIDARLGGPALDTASTAHLREVRDRVNSALDARAQKPWD